MSKKLLVADDSVTIQKVIKLALSSEGYDILAVSEGKEAIRAIQDERPDVVLIDVTLPGADAYSVKRAINANPALASIGFILMLSAFERIDEKAIGEVGFHARLIKPFDPSHLRKAVAELLNNPPSDKPAALAPRASGLPLQSVVPPPIVSLDLPAPPPPEEPSLTTESLSESMIEHDLPPVSDMHQMVPDEPLQAVITEEEFQVVSLPPAPPLVGEELTDPGLALPEETVTRSLENDIKDLTESTIKMSGLDEWNLDDSKKMKSPPPAPVAAPARPVQDDSTREMLQPSLEKKAAVLKNLMTAPSRTIDDGGCTFPIGSAAKTNAALPPKPGPRVVAPEPAQTAPPRITIPPIAPAIAPAPGLDFSAGRERPIASIEIDLPRKNTGSPPSSIIPPTAVDNVRTASPITRAEIEQLIRKDLEEAIEKLAREAVPRIAETIIRQEIERILAEP